MCLFDFLVYLGLSPPAIIHPFHAPQTTDCNGHDTSECTNVRLSETRLRKAATPNASKSSKQAHAQK
jgi:hypothetical protein